MIQIKNQIEGYFARAQTNPTIAHEYELEGRLGLKKPEGFVSGITHSEADKIDLKLLTLHSLSSNEPHIVRWVDMKIEDMIYDSENVRIRNTSILKSSDAESKTATPQSFETTREMIQKEKLGHTDFMVLQRKYDFRLGMKREQPIDPKKNEGVLQKLKNGKNQKARSIVRRSYWTSDGFRIDRSTVTNEETKTTTFECEIEFALVDPKSKKKDQVPETAEAFVVWMICLQNECGKPKFDNEQFYFVKMEGVDAHHDAAPNEKKKMFGVPQDYLIVSFGRQ